MEEMKQWYLSKTVWGALLAILATSCRPWEWISMRVRRISLRMISCRLPGAIGGLIAIYGRLTAEKRVG